MKYIKFQIILILAVMLVAGSCTEKFEDMNVDPNNPTAVPTTNILARALRIHADGNYSVWSIGNEHGSYAGHFGKIQYIDEARYQFRESVVNGRWNRYYLLLNDIQQAYNIALEDEDINMQAATLTFKSFIFQKITDEWGDVPYTNALKGDEGFLLPEYDAQSLIYSGIAKDLKQAAGMFDTSEPGLGDGDLLFGGDVALWQKWCNSIRLRVAIRMSNVDETGASAILSEVLGNATAYPIMESVSDMAALKWTNSSPYREPFWENHYLSNRDDHGVATYIIDEMLALNDPRIAKIANLSTDSVPTYRGIIPGLHTDDEGFALNSISRIGDLFEGRPDGYTYFQRYSEVLFIVAEAVHRGLVTGYSMTAQEAYEAAITASFEEMELTAADATPYIVQGSVAYETGTPGLTKIYMQKWLALFKSHEAWSESRRTDVPLMPAAPGSAFPGHNRPPFRYPYAQDEKNLNSANVAAAATGVVDHFWGKQMWWDTRSGVN